MQLRCRGLSRYDEAWLDHKEIRFDLINGIMKFIMKWTLRD